MIYTADTVGLALDDFIAHVMARKAAPAPVVPARNIAPRPVTRRPAAVKRAVGHSTRRAITCACGKTFVPKSDINKHCSESCRRRVAIDTANPHIAEARKPRPCKHCGQVFTPKRAGMLFCAKDCSFQYFTAKRAESRAARVQERECATCGKVFTTARKNEITCSDKCANRRDYLRNRARKGKPLKALMPVQVKTCKECGVSFDSTHPKQVYCSNQCGRRSANKRRPHVAYVWKPRTERQCVICGKAFVVQTSHGAHRITCGAACSKQNRTNLTRLCRARQAQAGRQ